MEEDKFGFGRLGLGLLLALCVTGCETSKNGQAWREHTRQGDAAYQRSDWNGAEKHYAAALEQAKPFDASDPRFSETLAKMAAVNSSLQKHTEAEALYRQRLTIDESRLQYNSAAYAFELYDLSMALAYQKKFDEAQELSGKAQSIVELKYGTLSQVSAAMLAGRANIYLLQGDMEKAETCLKDSQGRLESILYSLNYSQSPDSGIRRNAIQLQCAFIMNGLAMIYKEQEKYDKAAPLLKRSIGLMQHQWGRNSPSLITPLLNLTYIYHRQGKFEKADSTARRATNIAQKLPPENPAVAETHKLLALIAADRKKQDLRPREASLQPPKAVVKPAGA